MTNWELIKEAILNKKQVIADYNGFIREMCPHVLGYKNGTQQALFYQFGGNSSSGSIVPNSKQNWRCIPVEKLKNIKLRDGKWSSADNHSTIQTCVEDVHFEVIY